MYALSRRLAARRVPLVALCAITAVTSAFAALVAATGAEVLPQAAATDLLASPTAALTATRSAPSDRPVAGSAAGPGAGGLSTLPSIVRRAVGSGSFSTDTVTISDSLSLKPVPGTAPDSLIKAFSASGIERNAVLTSGNWPGPASPDAPIEAAAPRTVLDTLHLRVGSEVSLPDVVTGSTVRLRIVGAFRRAGVPASWWVWDEVGQSGSLADGPYTLFDLLAVDPSAFGPGALAADTVTTVILPTAAAARDLAGAQARSAAMSSALGEVSSPRYVLGGSLTARLAALETRAASARAELLVACLLVALVAAAGLAVAPALLVGESAAQDALNRARGASSGRLAATYWAELGLLVVAAALGALGGEAAAHATCAAVWWAAAGVALAVGAAVCARAARPPTPGQSALRRGRQTHLSRTLRDGADLALLALAALALWQASGSPLVGTGINGLLGTNPVVAAAPALVVAAAAAAAGRLVPAAARRAESVAGVARRLPGAFACWQLGRRPAGYTLPALICVAAMAGSSFALAQHGSRQRSELDQGSYNAGADVRVEASAPLPLDRVAALIRAHGVLSATAAVRVPQSGGASLLALDSATADHTVLLRPDLASQPPDELWPLLTSGAGPSAVGGLPVPGRPVALALQATLSSSPAVLPPATVTATVQDGVGLTYRIDLGTLPADGAAHTLSGALAESGSTGEADIDYPVRLLRVDLDYTAPSTISASAQFSISALEARGSGAHAAAVFASGAALGSWPVSSTWGVNGYPCGQTSFGDAATPDVPYQQSSVSPARRTPGGVTVAFDSGVGQNAVGPGIACLPISASVSLSAGGAGRPLPAIATSAYLRSTGTSIGATVPISVNGATLSARIVASVAVFPTLPATGPGALIVDLPTLTAATVAQGSAVFPAEEWWLSTANAAVPPGLGAVLPDGSSVMTAAGAVDSLANDPLTRATARPLVLGALCLLALAALCLAAGLAAGGGREQDRLLALLGAGRAQRVAIRCMVNAAVAVPAALLGTGLGWLVSRLLVPEFVLAPDGAPPVPAALVVLRPWQSALAVAGLVAVALAGPVLPALRAARRADLNESAGL